MNERAGGGAGVEEENVFHLVIRRGVSVAINDCVDLMKFSSDA